MNGTAGKPVLIRRKQAGGEWQEPRERRARKPAKPRVRFPRELIDSFKLMPELRHNSRPDLPFDICRSEVASWLIGTAVAQPVFRKALLDAAYHAGLIFFDRERKTWRGCAYAAENKA